MELKIIEEKKNNLVFEIIGEDHTLFNALRSELNNDNTVKIAGYNVSHPFIANPRMIIETGSSETPKKALQSAIKRLVKKNEKLLKGFKKF